MFLFYLSLFTTSVSPLIVLHPILLSLHLFLFSSSLTFLFICFSFISPFSSYLFSISLFISSLHISLLFISFTFHTCLLSSIFNSLQLSTSYPLFYLFFVMRVLN